MEAGRRRQNWAIARPGRVDAPRPCGPGAGCIASPERPAAPGLIHGLGPEGARREYRNISVDQGRAFHRDAGRHRKFPPGTNRTAKWGSRARDWEGSHARPNGSGGIVPCSGQTDRPSGRIDGRSCRCRQPCRCPARGITAPRTADGGRTGSRRESGLWHRGIDDGRGGNRLLDCCGDLVDERHDSSGDAGDNRDNGRGEVHRRACHRWDRDSVGQRRRRVDQ